ncbi:hypothetical protein [Catenulispora sp. EB89]|uniref:hypothetical protein n=1 Tax=Catenulispora sp. EB89 TaxID=3156257 RepID=UPI003515F2E6
MRPPQAVSQSTVADVFQSRRRRLNLDLVVAIVRALDLDDVQLFEWDDAQWAREGGRPA